MSSDTEKPGGAAWLHSWALFHQGNEVTDGCKCSPLSGSKERHQVELKMKDSVQNQLPGKAALEQQLSRCTQIRLWEKNILD